VLFESAISRTDYALVKDPFAASLEKRFDSALKKLDLARIYNLSLAYVSEETGSNTLNLTPYIEKIKYPAGTPSAFLRIKIWLADLFPSESSAYAVTANKNTAFGDSITEGYKSTGGGYPGRLQGLLGETVVNRGRGGEKTDDGLARLPGVLDADDPQRTLLMEGTNDINVGRSIGSIVSNLEGMVARTRGYGSTPYLATICPSNRHTQRTADLNANIKNKASALGVTNPDVNGAFGGTVTSQYFFDDIHPNDAGYDVIASTFKNAIAPRSSSGGGDGGGCGSVYLPRGGNGSGLNIFFVLMALFYLLARSVLSARRAR
jgi:lysophospholipase L1-like esterase